MTQDWPDYQPHAHMALAQYTQRVPLARNAISLGSNKAQVLGAGLPVNLVTTLPTDQPSIQMLLNTQEAVAANGTPFVLAVFNWFDAATGDPIAQRTYVSAIGSGQGYSVRLQGPARGDLLTVILVNDDTLHPITFDWSITAISHVLADDDYHSDGNIAVNTYASPAAAPDKGVLAFSNPIIVPGTPQTRLTPASNRLCKICINNTGQANGLSVVVGDPAPAINLYGSTGGVEFYANGNIPAGGTVNDEFQMPLGPALITMTNLGGAGNIQPKVTITEVGMG